jgi:excisionase family DNA binding protein
MTQPKSQRTLPDPMLTVVEVADWWGCSVDTVEAMIRRGELAAVRIGPKLVRIRITDAEAAPRPVQARESAS